MNSNNIGNYIGKKVGDYIILDKKRVNNRIKYFVKCSICNTEKWTWNVKACVHGTYCEGNKRKTGSKLIGQKFGDYVVVKKLVEQNRSCYLIKCTICNSTQKVWNLREKKHSEHCKNFLNYILGEKNGDFIITNAYRKDRVYVDVECLKCGCKRYNVAYKDFKSSFKNKHGKICTIKNNNNFENKKLVSKLLRCYQSINTRIRLDPAYSDVQNKFIDSIDFINYVYDMFNKRLIEENIPMGQLSIDRINPFGNYEKGNVRCLTLHEQQYNTRIHYKENVEAIEISPCGEKVE